MRYSKNVLTSMLLLKLEIGCLKSTSPYIEIFYAIMNIMNKNDKKKII